MADFVKKNAIIALYVMLAVAMFLSVLFNESKCPMPGACYFDRDFFAYALHWNIEALMAIKLFLLVCAWLTIWIVSRELKDDDFIPYFSGALVFSSLLSITAVTADVEVFSVLLLFLVLFVGKRYLKNPSFKTAFFVSFLLSIAIIVDLRNLVFLVTALLVLFLVDDVLRIISIKRILSFKSLAGLILGTFPFIVCRFYDIAAPFRRRTDDFSIDFNSYLFAKVFLYPWHPFDGISILTLFIPAFFIFSGMYALIKGEFRNVANHEKEVELSTVDDIVYYISVYFPVFYMIIMSALNKEKVSSSFFYPFLIAIPFLIKKGLSQALPFFNGEGEKLFIKRVFVFMCSLFFIIGTFSGVASLRNVDDARVAFLLRKFVENHPGKYMTDRYASVLGYVFSDSVFSFPVLAISNINQKDLWKDYDYYIPAKLTKENGCYIVTEPDLSRRLINSSFVKSWICSEPVLNYRDKLYIFKVDSLKLI